MSEWMLHDLCAISGLKDVILRYFNVAGSDPDGIIGQSTPESTLLIKVAAEVAMGKRDSSQAGFLNRFGCHGTRFQRPQAWA
jgi:UDP-glucose 4-epimerase